MVARERRMSGLTELAINFVALDMAGVSIAQGVLIKVHTCDVGQISNEIDDGKGGCILRWSLLFLWLLRVGVVQIGLDVGGVYSGVLAFFTQSLTQKLRLDRNGIVIFDQQHLLRPAISVSLLKREIASVDVVQRSTIAH